MKKYSLFTAIFLAFYLVFSLLTSPNFGVSWDEAAGQHIAKVELDLARGKIEKPDFLREDLVYYGPFFEMTNYVLGNFLQDNFQIEFSNTFHVGIILVGIVGLIFLFFLVREMFNEKIAFWAVCFLALSPHFFAHLHYNPKDIPLLTFFLGTLFFLHRTFILRKKRSLFWAGIFLGLGISIRLDMLFILPTFFLPYLFYWWKKNKDDRWDCFKGEIKLIGGLFLISVGSLFLSWPTLWKDPLIFWKALSYFSHHGWEGRVLYFSREYLASDLPWHFSLFHIFASFSILVWGLFFLGAGVWIYRYKQQKSCSLEFVGLLMLVWIFFRLVISFWPGVVRYDGSRHYLFIFPVVVILASYGLVFLLEKLRKRKIFQIGLIVFLIIFLSREFILSYPFGGAYFNEAVRTVYPHELEKELELDYWGVSLKQGVEWLNQNAKQGSVVCLPLAEHLLQYYPVRRDLIFSCGEADYLMFFTRQAYLPDNLETIFSYKNKKPIYQITVFGSDLLYIFKKS